MPKRKSKNKTRKKNPMQSVFTRYMLIVAIFVLWIGAIGVRLVHLQVNQHEWLREQALDQRQYEYKSKMLRGTIYDRSERVLAMSIKVKSLYADPSQIVDIKKTAEKISAVLKIDKKEIIKDLTVGQENNRQFVWIARKLDEADFQKTNKLLIDNNSKKNDLPKYDGLHWKEEQKRSYPYKTLAASVIGFTNSEEKGRAGIEMSQEEALKGEVASKMRERDRLGRIYDETEIKLEPPKNVVLTISSSIQYKTEEALAKGAKRSRAISGKAIVLDPKTGEILALANYPSFDPNDFRQLEPEMWKNRAIQDNYSPGSVFKLITYGSALDENLIEPENTIDCGNGTITVGGHTFKDSHKVGTVTYTKAFAHSSNVGAIKTGLKVGKNDFYKYARDFGFGEKTGIKLPAETSGILRSPDSWNGDSLASMSIGYEIGVTALQSASAFAIIANDGVKVQPHIVKEIRQSDGKIVSVAQPKQRRVVSQETARDLRIMLSQVVSDGTARRAQLNGYTSAGKTGTAWKYDAKLKKINRNKYVSSFIGFAPANNPRVVIAVVMDEPQGESRNGGQVAAPVFKEIAESILPELNVSPDGNMPVDITVEDEIPEENENQDVGEEPAAEQAESSDDLAKPNSKKKEVKRKTKPAEKTNKAGKKDKKKNGKRGKTAAINRKILRDREVVTQKIEKLET